MKEVAQAQLLLLGWERVWQRWPVAGRDGVTIEPLRLNISGDPGHHKGRAIEATFDAHCIQIRMPWRGSCKGITPPKGVTWKLLSSYARVVEADYADTVKAAQWAQKMATHQRGL